MRRSWVVLFFSFSFFLFAFEWKVFEKDSSSHRFNTCSSVCPLKFSSIFLPEYFLLLSYSFLMCALIHFNDSMQMQLTFFLISFTYLANFSAVAFRFIIARFSFSFDSHRYPNFSRLLAGDHFPFSAKSISHFCRNQLRYLPALDTIWTAWSPHSIISQTKRESFWLIKRQG